MQESQNIHLILQALNKFLRLLHKHPPTKRTITIAFLALISVTAAYYQHQVQLANASQITGITLQTPDGNSLPIVQLGKTVTRAAIFTADSSCLTLIAKQQNGQPE